MKRKKYKPELKAEVVLKLLREEKSVSQLSSEYGIHPTQLFRWRDEVIKNLSQLFADDRKEITSMKNSYEAKINELYAEVGRLTTNLTWLKKKAGYRVDQ